MKLTVRRAMVIAVLFGMLLPAIAAGIFFGRFFYSNKLRTEISRTLRQDSEVLALGIRESLWALDKESATALVEAVMQDPALVSVEILDPHLGRFVFLEIPERRTGNIHSTEQPVLHRTEIIGHIRLELSEAPLQRTLQTQFITLAGVLCLQLLISVVLILLVLQRRVGAPLLRLGDEAESLAEGRLDKPIIALRQDEIGQVEARLEVTRHALQGLFRTLEQKNLALEVDLGERRRVEAILRDREQRLRTLVEQSPLAVIEFDLGWHILAWNEAAENIFGWRAAEILGRHANVLIQTGTEGETCSESPFDHESMVTHTKLGCLRSDRTIITCQWYNNVIRDAAGNSQRIVAMVEDITERQKYDDEIRRLATVVRLTTHLVALANSEGRIEWHNQAFADCCIANQDLIGIPLIKALRDNEQKNGPSRIPEIETALRAGRQLTAIEICLHSRHREVLWVSMELQPLRGEDEKIQQWIALLTDITDRHAMNDALQNLAGVGGDLTMTTFCPRLLDIIAKGIGAKAAYLAIHTNSGFNVQAIHTSPGWTIKDGRHSLEDTVGGQAATHGSFVIKAEAYKIFAEDSVLSGCQRAEALVAEPIEDENRKVIGHIVALFAAPLTQPAGVQSLVALGASRVGSEFQRQRTLQALQDSEQKFSSIFKYSPIPIALLRRTDHVCLDINPSFLAHFGYPRDIFIETSLLETPLYADSSEREKALVQLNHANDTTGVDIRLRTMDGDIRDCQIYVRPVTMGDDPCLLIAAVDVTQLLEAQRQIAELNQSLERRVSERTHALANTNAELEKALENLRRTLDELVRTEKLAALGSLVAGIAHELNTPIGNSLMVSSTLHDATHEFRGRLLGGIRRSTLEEYVQEAETATDILMRNLGRAAELIANFKQVAVDQTSSQRRRFNLAEVTNEIIVTMQPVFRKTPFQIDNQIPSDINLDSYPGPFGQVIGNLLNNAVLHAFEGRSEGKITLSIESRDEKTICLHCRDNGAGIPPENLHKIFDPFFTTRLGREGTGLGLNIVHNIVTGVLGGEIRVSSQAGQGTDFAITLPLQAPLAAAATPSIASA